MEPENTPEPVSRDALPIAALKALRPKQWVKNVFLLAALVFSFEFKEIDSVIRTLWGIACFCLVSSTGYIFNDIRDKEADAAHPKKRKRPIASGALPVSMAYAEMAVIFVGGCALAYLLDPMFLGVTLCYFVTTMSYTLYFKHHVIVDIMGISAGFIWRVVAGAVAIGVGISPWLLICMGFFALFLGFNKRRGELMLLGEEAAGHRKNLKEYTEALLDEFQSITTSGTIISYTLYTVLGSPTPWLLLTLPCVLYGIFRYIYLVQVRGETSAPDQIVLSDRPIQATCVVYAIVALMVLKWAPLEIGQAALY